MGTGKTGGHGGTKRRKQYEQYQDEVKTCLPVLRPSPAWPPRAVACVSCVWLIPTGPLACPAGLRAVSIILLRGTVSPVKYSECLTGD